MYKKIQLINMEYKNSKKVKTFCSDFIFGA